MGLNKAPALCCSYRMSIDSESSQQHRIEIELTQGNINNNHIYLRNHLDFFPREAVGPPNKRDGLGTMLSVAFLGLPAVDETDIAGGNKLFFRSRTATKDFFACHAMAAGDRVVIERTGPLEYAVSPAR